MLLHFINMFSWWQWLVLGLVPPAIVALYFLKLKRRPLEVPSTYLWRKAVEDLHVNSLWQRLRRSLLLWLQLALVLLLVLALVRPGWQTTQIGGSRFVFLIDNSASMQATDVPPSRLAEAKRRVGEFIDQMKSHDVAMLVSFADTARIEQTFTDNRGLLRRSLEAIQPTQRSTSLGEALKVAAGLANPGRMSENAGGVPIADALPAKLLILSDGKFEDVSGFSLGNLEPVFVPIVSPQAANVAVTAFGLRRSESRAEDLQAFGRLENFGAARAEVSLELYHDGRLIGADRVTLEPDKPGGTAFDLHAIGSGTLRLRAVTHDHLALDDEAWAVIRPPRRSKVLLVTPGNEPLQWVLTTPAAAEIAEVKVQPPSYLGGGFDKEMAAAPLDLVIFDRCRPKSMPACNTLFIGTLPPGTPWSAKPKQGGPQIIDVDPAHPLTQWLDLGNVLVSEATPLVVPPGGTVLVDSQLGPLLGIAPRETFEDAVLGFNLLEQSSGKDGTSGLAFATDWPVKASFPVFIHNALSYLGGQRDATTGRSLRPGQSLTITPGGGVDRLDVTTPSGEVVPLRPSRPGEFTFTGTTQRGIYQVRHGATLVDQFAVNLFDKQESDIRPRPDETIKIGYVSVAGNRGWEVARRDLWKLLLLAGLAVALGEWYLYSRRVAL